MQPLPTPKSNETQSEFVNRCVTDSATQREFYDKKQGLAVCYSIFKRQNEEKETINKLNSLDKMFSKVGQMEDLYDMHESKEIHSNHIKRLAKNNKLVFYGRTHRFNYYNMIADETGIIDGVDDEQNGVISDIVKKSTSIMDEYLGHGISDKQPVDVVFGDLDTNENSMKQGTTFVDQRLTILNNLLLTQNKKRGILTLIHEYGHIFKSYLPGEESAKFEKWYKENISNSKFEELNSKGVVPTRYAMVDHEECFCELFAYFGVYPEFFSDDVFTLYSGVIEEIL